MTFLELCQRMAGETGVFNPGYTLPSTVTGQTGRLSMVVQWVQDAYRAIETMHDDWRWKILDLPGTAVTSSGKRTYGAAADFSMTRFGDWRFNSRSDESDIDYWHAAGLSSYLQSQGRSYEQRMRFRRWDEFRDTFDFGPATEHTGQPRYFSVKPDGTLVLYPTPDDVYVLIGQYVTSPQTLADDADAPEMPARFHDLIWLTALVDFCIFEETYNQHARWEEKRRRMLRQLTLDQRPRFDVIGAIV